ncbi:methylthioribose kinase [Pontibacillus yanchengensis]|uniref:Methylthioribose kinase n=2 Tax=Pontibacillus yanchengensis TaxID=462910 RepID=A0ACC7VBM5_9BACI|nr:methylthioribose kinase [Pontibacillus yanchengensis]MYL33022.1 methylthioribose kinase [Pontibacillus yanchengensis]MYL52128.1 methylthioribose kinase [Pontibacillus yanchengensis]
MIQRFIELGHGYSDIYELRTLGETMSHRVKHIFAFHTIIGEEKRSSVAIVMEPTQPGEFQPIYICREGIPYPHKKPNKRYDLIKQLAEELDKEVIELTVRPSNYFGETDIYYQHLTGILRMNNYIPPMK